MSYNELILGKYKGFFYKDTIDKKERNTMENYNKTDCLALTIRKEHRLIVINKTVRKTIIISAKAIFAAICLTLLNIFV